MGRRPNTPEQKAERSRAYRIVARALRSGELIRPVGCYDCGPLHAHHHLGYDHPLDIVWLCSAHHASAHANWGSIDPSENFDRGYLRWRIAIAQATIVECRKQLDVIAMGDVA